MTAKIPIFEPRLSGNERNNCDMGNSTWFGYDPEGELLLYARHFRSVHVKDCNVFDYSVPLGTGEIRFSDVFAQLHAANYNGNFVLPAARLADDVGAARDYVAFTCPLVAQLGKTQE